MKNYWAGRRYFRDEKGQSKIHYKYPERLENRIVPVAE